MNHKIFERDSYLAMTLPMGGAIRIALPTTSLPLFDELKVIGLGNSPLMTRNFIFEPFCNLIIQIHRDVVINDSDYEHVMLEDYPAEHKED